MLRERRAERSRAPDRTPGALAAVGGAGRFRPAAGGQSWCHRSHEKPAFQEEDWTALSEVARGLDRVTVRTGVSFEEHFF